MPNTSAQHLFTQRTTGHFPLTPVACVLLETQKSKKLHSALLYLDPILGVPLNPRTLEPATKAEEAIVHLPSRVKVAALVPTTASGMLSTLGGEAEAEAANHVRPLCVVLENLSVMLLPPTLSTINPRILLPAHGLYIFALNTEPATVSGYRVMTVNRNVTAATTNLTAQLLWHMHLSSEDYPQRILQAAVHPPSGESPSLSIT
ncbi:unnamed protein product [Hydatigera taeniaeformis]|uniref:Uncharacterized protein n=1 Tax=Hydatigena taeniaeformis TaxID=6205 RepID=A0A3P7FCC1_HYDTA|nr:unnamed protein product [Hydatigera taeniaeformis]